MELSRALTLSELELLEIQGIRNTEEIGRLVEEFRRPEVLLGDPISNLQDIVREVPGYEAIRIDFLSLHELSVMSHRRRGFELEHLGGLPPFPAGDVAARESSVWKVLGLGMNHGLTDEEVRWFFYADLSDREVSEAMINALAYKTYTTTPFTDFLDVVTVPFISAWKEELHTFIKGNSELSDEECGDLMQQVKEGAFSAIEDTLALVGTTDKRVEAQYLLSLARIALKGNYILGEDLEEGALLFLVR